MNLSITDLKKGTVIDLDGEPFRVVDYSQKVMGRGGSIVSLKIKSLTSGKLLDKTYKGNDQVKSADISSQEVQYLYQNAGRYYFMNAVSFDQFELGADQVGNAQKYIRDGDNVTILLMGSQPITLELPKNVELRVASAENAVRGDTTSALTKNATLETGLKIKVPAFIKTGDVVSVDTASGNYRERVKA